MKKRRAVTIKRFISICLTLAIIFTMTNTDVHASDLEEVASESDEVIITDGEIGAESSDENETIIFYDCETGETEEVQPGDEQGLSRMADKCATNIIGGDDRSPVSNTTGSPQRNVCFIEVRFPDGFEGRGTGTLVNFDVVLTAGHVIYQPDHGGYAEYIWVVPGMYDYVTWPLGTASCNGKIAAPSGWINSHNYNYDWAVFKLTKSFDTYQLYGYYKDNSVEMDRTVVTYGYPCDYGTRMMTCEGKVLSATDYTMNINNDTAEGDSGGAVIDKDLGYLVAVSSTMHKNGWGIPDYNTVVKINQTVVNAIKALSAN